MALPVVELLYGFPILDPQNSFYNTLYDGAFTSVSSTKLVLATDYGPSIVFKGNFTVSGGVVTGGTVDSFKVWAGDTKVMTESGLAISATALIDAIDDWQNVSNDPLDALLIGIPTKYIGSDQGDFITALGDGSVVAGRKGDDDLASLGVDSTLKGGKGNDLLLALAEHADMNGGQGTDVFAFSFASMAKIRDFDPSDDLIELNVLGFPGVDEGFLHGDQFKVGGKASTEDQIILYQKNKGNLWYDQDGSGTTYDPVKIAKMDKGLDLTAHHFLGGFDGSLMAI
jgi:Ca2+-binding RTX toxin-like protein